MGVLAPFALAEVDGGEEARGGVDAGGLGKDDALGLAFLVLDCRLHMVGGNPHFLLPFPRRDEGVGYLEGDCSRIADVEGAM